MIRAGKGAADAARRQPDGWPTGLAMITGILHAGDASPQEPTVGEARLTFGWQRWREQRADRQAVQSLAGGGARIPAPVGKAGARAAATGGSSTMGRIASLALRDPDGPSATIALTTWQPGVPTAAGSGGRHLAGQIERPILEVLARQWQSHMRCCWWCQPSLVIVLS